MSRISEGHQIVDEWLAAGHDYPLQTEQIAAWAIQTRRWEPSTQAALRLCAHQIADALREDYLTDPRGRRVRAKHPRREKQGNKQIVLWDDIRTAPRSHMEVAFQQRRNAIVGDCRQLKTDVDSFNEYGNTEGRPIQLVLNFSDDVAELEAALPD